MFENLIGLLSTVPNFLLYVLVALCLLGLFCRIYTWATPYHELDLIREGNTAAAFSLVCSVVGFALVLASAIVHSRNLLDMVLWGVVGLVMQYLTYLVVSSILKDFKARIQNNQFAAALMLGGLSVATGIINAACISY